MITYRSRLSTSLASIYFAWSLLVYFGTFKTEWHELWPMFLYPLIWPLSAVYELLTDALFSWCFSARPTPAWVFASNDYLAGGFYIVAGSTWIFFLPALLKAMGKGLLALLAGKENDA